MGRECKCGEFTADGQESSDGRAERDVECRGVAGRMGWVRGVAAMVAAVAFSAAL